MTTDMLTDHADTIADAAAALTEYAASLRGEDRPLDDDEVERARRLLLAVKRTCERTVVGLYPLPSSLDRHA